MSAARGRATRAEERPRAPTLGSLGLALGFAGVLAALSFVAWRQSSAFETLRRLEALRADRALLEAEHWELRHRIEQLESRARVEPAARRELRMHVPRGGEIVILSLEEGPSAPPGQVPLQAGSP